VVRRFADRNFRIAATYLVPDEAESLESELHVADDGLLLRRVDCTDAAAVGTFVGEVADRFGPFNVLAALVGGWSGGRDVQETDDIRFDRMIDLNLRTAFNAARAALPHMRAAAWGRIVMVGSRAAIEPAPGQAMYNAAKAGVIALARTIAQEVADHGITANVVLPSLVDTPTFRDSVPYADYVRWPTPEEIAAVIDFLASPDSGVVNGAMIPVYGAS
jgi:NAD(P)-dependent dehydrogenase (short-subunit alcohol dehydrogenase family)